jgi:hypothetical protein
LDGQYQAGITNMNIDLQCITNFVEGIMTVFPSILVSELPVVITGGTTGASETAIIPDGINVFIPYHAFILMTFITLQLFFTKEITFTT